MFKFIEKLSCEAATGAAFGLLILATPNVAQADQYLNCDIYAKQAVQQQQHNITKKCGQSGVGWSNSYQAHFNWCRQANVKINHVSDAHRFRAELLAKCNSSKAGLQPEPKFKPKVSAQNDIACGKYAIRAREQNHQARQRKCGFKGGAWSDNVNGHRSWCLNAGIAKATAQSNARKAKIIRCNITKKFSRPTVNMRKSGIYGRLPIDTCLINIVRRGIRQADKALYCNTRQTAERFCANQGYRQVEAYSTEVAVSKSKPIGSTTGPRQISGFLDDKGYCGGRKCTYFNRIICKHPK